MSADVTLEQLLSRVSASLEMMAATVADLEDALGAERAPEAQLGRDGITRLQSLDFLRQTLEDLSVLSLALSKDHQGIVRPEIAEDLRLAATRELFRACPQPVAPKRADDSGAVDLF